MERIERSRKYKGQEITAQFQRVGEGLRGLVSGGQQPHIGAVSVIGQDGRCVTLQFPGHRDGAVSEMWARAAAEAGFVPAVVEAGIHYDGLRKEEIEEIMDLCGELLEEVLDAAGEEK